MAAYPENLLRPGEHVRAHLRPHWRMLVVPALVPPVAAGLAAWFAAVASTLSWHAGLWVGLAAVVVVAVGWFSLVPLLRWRCTHFVVTDRRLLVREGVLSRAGVEVAGTSVVEVRTRQRPAERFVGCGTLVVLTRGTSEPWEFSGIGRVEHTAARLEEMAEERGGLVPDPDDEIEDDADDADATGDVEQIEGGWGAWPDGADGADGADEKGSRFSRRRARAARTSR